MINGMKYHVFVFHAWSMWINVVMAKSVMNTTAAGVEGS
jgi:hypothetical protein